MSEYPTHTILWRGMDENERALDPVTLSQWRQATKNFPSFHVTDRLRQQNPFTHEFLEFRSEGSGYWECKALEGPVWSEDDLVWFRYTGAAVLFILFNNREDPELFSLANSLNAWLSPYQIGEPD
ncbi:MAG: hypothetical protein AAGA92_07805 [Planctomycetota bacterium]